MKRFGIVGLLHLSGEWCVFRRGCLGAGSSLLNELKSIAGVGVLIDDEDAALEVKPHCGSTSGALLSRKLVGKGDVRRPFAFVLTMG